MINTFGEDKHENNPFKLDWGEVTPEKYNESVKEAFYVCNFCMKNEEARNSARLFLAGKVSWYSNHLPIGTLHRIRMDIRGQYIDFGKLKTWKSELVQLSEKKGNVVSVEFHTD